MRAAYYVEIKVRKSRRQITFSHALSVALKCVKMKRQKRQYDSYDQTYDSDSDIENDELDLENVFVVEN